MSPVMSLEDEMTLRMEAMAWLSARTNDGRDAITRTELKQFVFRGERRSLVDLGRGIRKLRECRAALTIMTVSPAGGRSRPYEDIAGRDGLPRYKFRQGTGDEWDNQSVREAMWHRLPLIWLVGVEPGVFQAIFPVYVVGEERVESQFVLAYDLQQVMPEPESPLEQVMRRYVDAVTSRRLHQPVFRSIVMRAYQTQCAVCALRHSELLDAAHIVPDGDERGVAAVTNGLALCKIHHAAYDHHILGITPDLRIAIRQDILDEVDGPLLEHGIKALNGESLRVLPHKRTQRPDPELLAVRFEQFRSA